jgi:peptidoglycan/LPS O-acetylase OafA/YrhL
MNLPVFRRMPMYQPSFRGDLLLLLTALAACYAFSTMSWNLFEKKILGLKTRFEGTRNSEIAEAALSLTI